jgi:hypothetical protein
VRGNEPDVRLARTLGGQWWWLGATGEAQVCCALHGVEANVSADAADTLARDWGFNLLLPPVAEAFTRKGAAHVHDLGLARIDSGGLREEGVALPDVFDPSWGEAVEQVCNGVSPAGGLVGWWSDDHLRWGEWAEPGQPLERPGLLQVCLGLDPTKRAYHAAWEFVLARHGGELTAVATAWEVELNSRGQVRELTRDEQVLDTSAYRRDLTDFVQEFAQRYFTTVRTAASKTAPDRLLLSPRLESGLPPAVIEAAASHCDLLRTSTPGLAGGAAPELWSASPWHTPELRAPETTGESELEAALRNGRCQLAAALQHSAVIGYAWEWFQRGDLATDDPLTAGLVDDNGRTNLVLAAPLTALNAAAATLRAEVAPASS